MKVLPAQKEEVDGLAKALNDAVIAFHARRGIHPVDVRLVCEASAVVMTSYMVKTDAWTGFQLMNHSFNLLTYGIRTAREQAQLDAEHGSRSA